MRYYQIVVSEPKSGRIWQPTSTGALVLSDNTISASAPPLQGSVTTDAASGLQVVTVLGRRGAKYTFTSHPNGGTQLPDPGALNIEFDCAISPEDTPQGGTVIRLHGVGLAMIGQAANLNGQDIALYAGMGRGLPLANPAQAGLIMSGSVLQCFGNWEGTDQTLDLICLPGGTHPEMGVMFDWQPGTTLQTALQTTLQQAFSQYKVSMNIAIGGVPPPKGAAQQGHYSSLNSFSAYLREITQPLGAQVTNNRKYPGVRIARRGGTIYVYDAPTRTVPLNFQDFIGQPTWISAISIGFKTVLRADIQVGDLVRFPQGVIAPYALTSPSAALPNAPSRSKLAFQGDFFVQEVHHFANFRQADAMSWNTSFVASVDPFVADVSLMSAFPAL